MMRLLLPVSLLLFNGCATINHGRTQQILVTSAPLGAVVTVDGEAQGQTPMIAQFARRKAHTLTVELEGFAAQSRELSPQSRVGPLTLNLAWISPPLVLLGGGVDLINGAHRHFPYDQLSFQFESRNAVSPAPSSEAVVTPPLVPIGKRVRVVHSGGPTNRIETTIGTLRAYAADTLLVEAASPGVLYRIPQGFIASLDMSLGGEHSRVSGSRVAGGALIGLLVGLGADLIGTMDGGDPEGFGGGLIAGGVVGAGIGAMIRPRKSHTEKWLNVCCGSAR